MWFLKRRVLVDLRFFVALLHFNMRIVHLFVLFCCFVHYSITVVTLQHAVYTLGALESFTPLHSLTWGVFFFFTCWSQTSSGLSIAFPWCYHEFLICESERRWIYFHPVTFYCLPQHTFSLLVTLHQHVHLHCTGSSRIPETFTHGRWAACRRSGFLKSALHVSAEPFSDVIVELCCYGSCFSHLKGVWSHWRCYFIFDSARQKFVRRAWEKAEISQKWAESSWAKKIQAREKVKKKKRLECDLFS